MLFSLKQVAVAAIVIVGLATSARADDRYDKCMQGAETNAEFGKCGEEWIKREDAKLNATWKRLHGAATGQTKKDLLAEQRLWIAFRESACKFYANGDWGRESQVIDALACQAGLIADRTKELEEYLMGISGE
ncbi:MAG: lysozyme inhibitor LprI family protein [Dichotomicrobium sp.]